MATNVMSNFLTKTILDLSECTEVTLEEYKKMILKHFLGDDLMVLKEHVSNNISNELEDRDGTMRDSVPND